MREGRDEGEEAGQGTEREKGGGLESGGSKACRLILTYHWGGGGYWREGPLLHQWTGCCVGTPQLRLGGTFGSGHDNFAVEAEITLRSGPKGLNFCSGFHVNQAGRVHANGANEQRAAIGR